jgi:hypothetical protein
LNAGSTFMGMTEGQDTGRLKQKYDLSDV